MAISFLFSNHSIGECIAWDGATKFASGLVMHKGRLIYGQGYSIDSGSKGQITYRRIDDCTVEFIWYE